MRAALSLPLTELSELQSRNEGDEQRDEEYDLHIDTKYGSGGLLDERIAGTKATESITS